MSHVRPKREPGERKGFSYDMGTPVCMNCFCDARDGIVVMDEFEVCKKPECIKEIQKIIRIREKRLSLTRLQVHAADGYFGP